MSFIRKLFGRPAAKPAGAGAEMRIPAPRLDKVPKLAPDAKVANLVATLSVPKDVAYPTKRLQVAGQEGVRFHDKGAGNESVYRLYFAVPDLATGQQLYRDIIRTYNKKNREQLAVSVLDAKKFETGFIEGNISDSMPWVKRAQDTLGTQGLVLQIYFHRGRGENLFAKKLDQALTD